MVLGATGQVWEGAQEVVTAGMHGLRAGMSILQHGSPLRTSHQPASLQPKRKHQTEGSTFTKASSVVEELAKAFCRGGGGDSLISDSVVLGMEPKPPEHWSSAHHLQRKGKEYANITQKECDTEPG